MTAKVYFKSTYPITHLLILKRLHSSVVVRLLVLLRGYVFFISIIFVGWFMRFCVLLKKRNVTEGLLAVTALVHHSGLEIGKNLKLNSVLSRLQQLKCCDFP